MSQSPFHFQVSEKRERGFLVTTVTVVGESVPQEFDGFRFAQITDLHLGKATPVSDIAPAFELINGLDIDLVFCTGDYVQVTRHGMHHKYATSINPAHVDWLGYRRKARDQAKHFSDLLKTISPQEGIIGVLGNHDYYEGLASIKRLTSPSMKILVNEQAYIEKASRALRISGLDDWKAGKPDVEKTLISKKEDANSFFHVLLSHNPDVTMFKNKDVFSNVNLILSGHTHGGQICMPFVGPVVTRTKQRKHVTGLSSLSNQTKVYVNNGLGCQGFSIRVLCPREISVFEFKKS